MDPALKIADVRASLVSGAGADYHDQQGRDHWIDGRIATPMARYPEFRETRSSFGLDVLGSLVVEIEDGRGNVGVGVSTGGVPGSWVVEEHLSRFVIGRGPWELELVWDQMFNATLFYGRKGLVLNALSAVDLAMWDLLGRQRELPVWAMLGGKVRDELVFYATGPRPDLAQALGFIGGKMPLEFGPWAGREGLEANVARLASMREEVGDDFWLMYDCWMALDARYALELLRASEAYGLTWLEEFLPPDDYWGYAQVRRENSTPALITTGEHEATMMGFRMLLDMGCADIIQPDVAWCGGLTELVRISALADAQRVLVIPHGSSVYSYHFVTTRHHSPFAEFLMMHPDASEVVPMFDPLLVNEPVPIDGRLAVPDRPGFGVDLNRDLDLTRPFNGPRW